MANIHPQACVDPAAKLATDVRVGPFCVVDPGVEIGSGCVLHNSVTVTGRTRLGADNELFPGAVLGTSPQDLKYQGTQTELQVGNGNIFRECVTVHCGTEVAGGITKIGDGNRLLAGVHVAHDSVVGNNCIIANYVQLAGHVHVEDCCHIGGLAAFHHFVTIGRYSYVAGMARVTVDVPPYMIVQGYPARVRGLNVNGISRWGLDGDTAGALKKAYRALFPRKSDDLSGNILERIERVEADGAPDQHTRYLCEFLRRSTRHGVYGRFRESLRTDSSEDRDRYYRPPAADDPGHSESEAEK